MSYTSLVERYISPRVTVLYSKWHHGNCFNRRVLLEQLQRIARQLPNDVKRREFHDALMDAGIILREYVLVEFTDLKEGCIAGNVSPRKINEIAKDFGIKQVRGTAPADALLLTKNERIHALREGSVVRARGEHGHFLVRAEAAQVFAADILRDAIPDILLNSRVPKDMRKRAQGLLVAAAETAKMHPSFDLALAIVRARAVAEMGASLYAITATLFMDLPPEWGRPLIDEIKLPITRTAREAVKDNIKSVLKNSAEVAKVKIELNYTDPEFVIKGVAKILRACPSLDSLCLALIKRNEQAEHDENMPVPELHANRIVWAYLAHRLLLGNIVPRLRATALKQIDPGFVLQMEAVRDVFFSNGVETARHNLHISMRKLLKELKKEGIRIARSKDRIKENESAGEKADRKQINPIDILDWQAALFVGFTLEDARKTVAYVDRRFKLWVVTAAQATGKIKPTVKRDGLAEGDPDFKPDKYPHAKRVFIVGGLPLEIQILTVDGYRTYLIGRANHADYKIKKEFPDQRLPEVPVEAYDFVSEVYFRKYKAFLLARYAAVQP